MTDRGRAMPPRTFSCVVDSAPGMAYSTWVWAVTLTTLGGRDPSSLAVHFVEGCAPDLRRTLEEMGIGTLDVDRVDPRNPPSNKLAQFSSPLLAGGGFRILCDCDLAFCSDISPWATGGRVRAKIVDLARFDMGHWDRILSAAGLRNAGAGSDPIATAVGTLDGDPTIPTYVNGGMLIVPPGAFEALAEAWPRWDRWVLEHRELLGQIRYHVNQVSFALACLDAGVEIDHLPPELNLPTHIARLRPHLEGVDPRVLHFHHWLDPGGRLKPTGVASVDGRIAEVNALIEERQGQDFDRALLRSVGSGSTGTRVRRRVRGGMSRVRTAFGG
jgi:hypothetical protein